MSIRDDLINDYGTADTAPLGTLTDLRRKLDVYRAEVAAGERVRVSDRLQAAADAAHGRRHPAYISGLHYAAQLALSDEEPPSRFFQRGHTYTYTLPLRSKELLVGTFVVTNVSTSPDGLRRVAQGWRRDDLNGSDTGGWEPADADDFTGWVDVTEGGAR